MEEELIINEDLVIEEPKKSSSELKNELIGKTRDIDNVCDNDILKGFVYKDIPVVLSTETKINLNQLTVKVIADLKEYPILFNLGGGMYSFTGKEEFIDFTNQLEEYVAECYARCWQDKATLKAEYDELIKEAEEREIDSMSID